MLFPSTYIHYIKNVHDKKGDRTNQNIKWVLGKTLFNSLAHVQHENEMEKKTKSKFSGAGY